MRAEAANVWVPSLVVLCALCGCQSLPSVRPDKQLLDIVSNPGITREAIVLKMGEPSASFEADRILTYRIGEEGDKGYFLLDRQVRWTDTKYSLVLVFDEKGVLTKHSLVRIR